MSEIQNDEIDLKEMVQAILRTKTVALVALVLISGAYWAFASLSNLAYPSVHSFTSRINLVFNGVSNSQYPNGAGFSISDLISPVILSRVYDTNDLVGIIERKDFVGAFNVAPYTPDRAFILAKYRNLLDDKKLGSAEIEALQAQLSAELEKASKDSVAISFVSTKADKLPEDMVKKVLRDIPTEWARHMIEDVGVTQLNYEMFSDKIIDRALYDSTDYLIAFEMLLEKLRLLEGNLRRVKKMPNGIVASDSESGFSIIDLENAVDDMQKYQLIPLINPVRYLGIAKNPEIVKLYFENSLRELLRNQDVLKEKKQNVEATYNAYIQYERNRSEAQSTAGLTTGGLIPQIGDEFINRIVELTNAGADINYRQNLNTKLLEISDELADSNGEVVRIREILDSLSSKNDLTSEERAMSLEYEEQIKQQMPMILDRLEDYFRISNRIYKKLSVESLGSAGYMFRPADGEIDYSVSGNILTMSNFRMYLILCFLTVILVVPIVMVRNSLRNSEADTE